MTYTEFQQNAPDWMHDEFITDFHTYHHSNQTVEEYWNENDSHWIDEYEFWLETTLAY